MGDDRYDDSAALCQCRLSVDHTMSSAVPILLPVIDEDLFALRSACLGSSKGMVSPRTVPGTQFCNLVAIVSPCLAMLVSCVWGSRAVD